MTPPWQAVTSAALLEAGLAPRLLRELLRGEITPSQLGEEWNEVLTSEAGSPWELTQLGDARYPAQLAAIRTPPPVLWGRGGGCGGGARTLRAGVAVVGTREMSSYGQVVAELSATAAVEAGVPVHSGLARGVDAAAHQRAVDLGGESAAVLGGGVDAITPRQNLVLGEALLARGAIISEQPPGTAVRPGMLMARNRITVGLAAVVVIAEARPGSGTMGAVWAALEEGRPIVVALPRAGAEPPGAEIPRLLASPDLSGLLALKPPKRARERLEGLRAAGSTAASGVARSREELGEILTALVRFSPWHVDTERSAPG